MFDSSTIFICSYLVNWNVNKRTPFATKWCFLNGVFSATIKNDFLEEIFDRLKVKRRKPACMDYLFVQLLKSMEIKPHSPVHLLSVVKVRRSLSSSFDQQQGRDNVVSDCNGSL